MTYAITLKEVEHELSDLFHTYGPKALHFVECVGLGSLEHCVKQVADCASKKGCIEALSCEGKELATCAKQLN
jgi:hypothetical protein